MPEHRIRFRGGWELWDGVSDSGMLRRLSLPVDWSGEFLGPIRLIRRFGRPAIDPANESVMLELRDVAGLQRIDLNGLDLGSPPSAGSVWTIPLDVPLADRNILTLDVFLDEVSLNRSPTGWGSIALVIVPMSRSVE